MKYTVRTPGYNIQTGTPVNHAVIRDKRTKLVSVCNRKVASSWRKLNGGTVTCVKCIKRLANLAVSA